jgi:hypothetical protein
MFNDHARRLSPLVGLFVSSLGFLMSVPGLANAQPTHAEGTRPALFFPVNPGVASVDTNRETPLVHASRSFDLSGFAWVQPQHSGQRERGWTPSRDPILSRAIDREAPRVLRAPWFSMDGNLLAQQPGPTNRGWIGRHPALFGMLVGAGAGVALANTVDNEWFCSGSDEDCLFYTAGSRTLVGAGMGAGVGALVGWLVGLGAK